VRFEEMRMKATAYCKKCDGTKEIAELSYTPKETVIKLQCGHEYRQKCNRGSLVLR
jgi:hypothetical protein